MLRDTLNLSRRHFLLGGRRGQKPVPRPPWAVPQFPALCNRCGNCRDACAQRIIVLTDSGHPQIDFNNGACTFCGDCAERCPTGALSRGETSALPWMLRARVGNRCLALDGVVCQVCREQCAARAIFFPPGPAAAPFVDSERCNGCGACVAPCPVQAISMIDHARADIAGRGAAGAELLCT